MSLLSILVFSSGKDMRDFCSFQETLKDWIQNENYKNMFGVYCEAVKMLCFLRQSLKRFTFRVKQDNVVP